MTSIDVSAEVARKTTALATDPWDRGLHTFRRHRTAVERAIAHMRANFAEPLTLDTIAKVAHCSPWHFDRTFTAITGLSPMRYLSILRIDGAKSAVLRSDRRIIDIAYDVGYNSLGSFGKRFTELVGLSPRELRSAAGRFDLKRWHATLEQACDQQLPQASCCGPAIAGEVTWSVPSCFRDWAIITAITGTHATARPAGWTVARLPGKFLLAPLQFGTYSIFAIGYSGTMDLSEILIHDGVHRGRIDAVELSPHSPVASIAIALHPPQSCDVPILPPYPILLERTFSVGLRP